MPTGNPFTTGQAAQTLAPTDYTVEQNQVLRQQQLADLLRKQAMEQGGGTEMVSGWAVKKSPLEGLSKIAQALGGRYLQSQADEKQLALAKKIREQGVSDMQGVMGAMNGQAAVPSTYQADTFDDADKQQLASDMGTQAIAPDRRQAMALALQSQNPMVQGIGAKLLEGEMKEKKPIVVGRSLLDEQGKVVGVDSTWQGEQQAAREARITDQQALRDQRIQELQLRLEDQRLSRADQAALRKEIAGMQIGARRDIAQMTDALRQQKNVPKLPTSALKMQQEELDAIGTAGTIDADLGALKAQIDGGKLQLGPVKNLFSKGKNIAGVSDENSRNFQSFQSTLEKLRNDSLRLNRGVQTEGDSVRAWNELLNNINDPKVASQRLTEIQGINKRAANMRKMNIDAIRTNFGVDPMDTQKYSDQAPAVGVPTGTFDAEKEKRYQEWKASQGK